MAAKPPTGAGPAGVLSCLMPRVLLGDVVSSSPCSDSSGAIESATLCCRLVACFGMSTNTVCHPPPAALPRKQWAYLRLQAGETIDLLPLPLQHQLVNDGLINALPREPCSELRALSGLPTVSKEARKVALEAAGRNTAIAAAAAGGHLQEIRDACKAKCVGQVSLHCICTAALLCSVAHVLPGDSSASAGRPATLRTDSPSDICHSACTHECALALLLVPAFCTDGLNVQLCVHACSG